MNKTKKLIFMKKIALLFFSAALVLAGGIRLSAQGKYGPDSAECIKYLSYYKEYYKQKNYDEALPHWRKAFKLCPPTANQTMLIDGTSLMRQLMNKNKNNVIMKNAILDTLLMIHDIRAEYYPKYAVTSLNNKGLDMINYMKDDTRKLYDGFNSIIEANKENTLPQIFLFQLNAAVELYKKGVITSEEVISEYEKAAAYIAEIEETKPSETVTKIKTDIESLFITSKVASCESLIALFTPRYEANPDDIELASNIVRMMSITEDCTDNDLFLHAATTMHRLDPSSSSSYFLYRLYSSKGDMANAIMYLEEAIKCEDSDQAQDGQYEFELAACCFKEGQSAKAYEFALKAAQDCPELAGKAYLLAGTIWGSLVCKGNDIETRAPYWVAVDYMIKAKNADPSLAGEANNQIAVYSKYYPQTAEAFMYNIEDGQSYTVSCGGLRATTTVRTQK